MKHSSLFVVLATAFTASSAWASPCAGEYSISIDQQQGTLFLEDHPSQTNPQPGAAVTRALSIKTEWNASGAGNPSFKNASCVTAAGKSTLRITLVSAKGTQQRLTGTLRGGTITGSYQSLQGRRQTFVWAQELPAGPKPQPRPERPRPQPQPRYPAPPSPPMSTPVANICHQTFILDFGHKRGIVEIFAENDYPSVSGVYRDATFGQTTLRGTCTVLSEYSAQIDVTTGANVRLIAEVVHRPRSNSLLSGNFYWENGDQATIAGYSVRLDRRGFPMVSPPNLCQQYYFMGPGACKVHLNLQIGRYYQRYEGRSDKDQDLSLRSGACVLSADGMSATLNSTVSDENGVLGWISGTIAYNPELTDIKINTTVTIKHATDHFRTFCYGSYSGAAVTPYK